MNDTATPKSTAAPTRRSALQIWLILGISASVLLGTFLIFPHSEEQRQRLLTFLGTSNKGVLLKPAVSLAGLPFTDQAGEPLSLSAQKPHWRLLIPVADGCAKACRDTLYLTRQVHVRLEKNAHRLERILLNIGAPLEAETMDFLKREHPRLIVLNSARGSFEGVLARTNGAWSPATAHTYVVDPNGVAMLYFKPQHSGGDVLADLRHLMKYSSEP